jgi:hypothetical protein
MLIIFNERDDSGNDEKWNAGSLKFSAAVSKPQIRGKALSGVYHSPRVAQYLLVVVSLKLADED